MSCFTEAQLFKELQFSNTKISKTLENPKLQNVCILRGNVLVWNVFFLINSTEKT